MKESLANIKIVCRLCDEMVTKGRTMIFLRDVPGDREAQISGVGPRLRNKG